LKVTVEDEGTGGNILAAQYRTVLLCKSYGAEGNQPHLIKDSA
jgi:hypothetical protein